MLDLNSVYHIDKRLESRSISFENPTGARGAGGRAASPLGVGRKGDPARVLRAGETFVLADIEGPGTLRHIWMTTHHRPELLRGAVVRIFWEGQSTPSVEAPLGDFFGFAHGTTPAFQTALHCVGERYGMNSFVPMPFVRHARVELANESGRDMICFYQIDYTVGDDHDDEVGRLHVLFRRENPTTAGHDFALLPQRSGHGRYLGAVLGIRPHASPWWGEGEIKVFLDGDDAFATIVGTGSEDYVGLSWGIQQTPFLYCGASLVSKADTSDSGPVSMYRWHIPDPVLWHEDVRITMQQIGHDGASPNLDAYKSNLYERTDDWSTCTFWYEPTPSAALPALPTVDVRCADLG